MAAAQQDPDIEKMEATPLLKDKKPLKSYSGTKATEAKAKDEPLPPCDDLLPPTPSGHHPHLDITRIICVFSVAIDHGESSFGYRNMSFGQSWCLQYLFLVSGVCFAMSGRSLVSYESRLAMYVGLGVFVNWSAWVVMSLDWRNDMFNVVFHLWFVVGLMACCAALAPLRPYLHWVRERNRKLQLTEHGPATTQSPSRGVESGEDRSAAQRSADRDYFVNALAVIGGGLLALMLLFNMVISPMLAKFAAPYVLHFSQEIGGKDSMWGIPQDSGESQAFVADMCTYCLLTCSNVFLVVVCPFYVRDTGLIGWALLLNTYAHRILFYRGSNERPFHGLDLMMLAMTCYYLGLKHRQKLGEYVIRYWFAIIFLCALLWPPSVMERLDEHPPHDAGVRARFALLEFVYVTAFLVAGERLVQPEIFTQDKMDFLNEWALLIFLIHKAVHIILAPPFNWLFLVCTIPAVYVARRGLPV